MAKNALLAPRARNRCLRDMFFVSLNGMLCLGDKTPEALDVSIYCTRGKACIPR